MPVLADKVPYPYISSRDAKEYLVERMLYRFHTHGKDPEIDGRIEAAYRKRYGYNMLGEAKVENVCLHGTPGVGKTTAIRQAASEVARILGMNYVENPIPPYLPGPNDLVSSTIEMSGEISNIVMGGIPLADTLDNGGSPLKYMNKLPLYQLAIARLARLNVLNLDDFVNAAPPVQNAALSIALEGRFQMMDIGNSFVGLTANLGSLDNSDTSPLSDPMTARIGHFYVEDEIQDYVARTYSRHHDAISDAHITGFLERNTDVFIMPTDSEFRSPVNGLRQPFPCPRSWDKLMNEMRILIHGVNSSKREIASGSDISRLAEAFIGKHAASKFSAYVYTVMTGAAPISRKLIEDGVLDVEAFDKKYKDGFSDRGQDFGFQMAFTLSADANHAISKNPSSLELVIERFATGIMRLSEPQIALSISDLASRLSYSTPSLALDVDKEKANADQSRRLNQDAVDKILEGIIRTGKKIGFPASEAMSRTIADGLAGANVYRTQYESGKSRKSKSNP